jgi:hypothetical protein
MMRGRTKKAVRTMTMTTSQNRELQRADSQQPMANGQWLPPNRELQRANAVVQVQVQGGMGTGRSR